MVLVGVGTALELVKSDSEIAMHNFEESLRAEETRKKYVYALDTYIEFLGLKGKRQELSLLLQNQSKDIENSVISYVIKLRKEDYSYSTILTRVSGIISFFEINDIVLNKKKIYRFMGEHIKTIKDRAYTREEIQKIFACCNLKYKVIISLLTSTGCRIGAISKLKVSDLRYVNREKLHQIFFYTNTKEEYYSFCTPECSKYIMEYLEYRQRCGEKITLDTPLIRNDFQQDDLLKAEHPRPQTTHTFEFHIREMLIRAGLRIPIKQEYRGAKKKMRKEVSANHGFRKYVHTIMANSNVLPECREMMLGHSIGLSDAYYRPTEKRMLQEYLKVVDELTINDENRLKRANQELKEKLEDRFNKIDLQLNEIQKQMRIIN
jgi:integrase